MKALGEKNQVWLNSALITNKLLSSFTSLGNFVETKFSDGAYTNAHLCISKELVFLSYVCDL